MTLDGTVLNVTAHYTFHSQAQSDSIYFILNPEFNITGLESNGLKSYSVAMRPDRPFPFWLLEYDKPIESGDTREVTFTYSIDLVEQNHLKSGWIELNADKLWFPNYSDLDNYFTYDVTIRGFPDSLTLITHTDARTVRTADSIYIEKQTPWAEALILAGTDMRQHAYQDWITVYAHKQLPDTLIESIARKVAMSIELLNIEFGMGDPILSFTVVLRNTPKGEIGFQFNRGTLIVTGPEYNDYANLSHEIAHYWWSKASFVEEPWINESFANYSMYLVLRQYDPTEYKTLLSRNQKIAEEAIPVREASLFTAGAYPSFYHKGAILLLDLEEHIGYETMMELISSCISESVDSTEGFLQQLESITDTETRDMFEMWLST